MNFVSIRVITDDVERLAGFYAQVTGVTPRWGNDEFAEIVSPAGTLAIASTRTIALRRAAHAADNHSVIIEFRWMTWTASTRSCARSVDFVNEPTTLPWGNRSLLLRDPDGNLINFFTPVTPEALSRTTR
jgi:predicted enzyme related to lactoylglutathione lyase